MARRAQCAAGEKPVSAIVVLQPSAGQCCCSHRRARAWRSRPFIQRSFRNAHGPWRRCDVQDPYEEGGKPMKVEVLDCPEAAQRGWVPYPLPPPSGLYSCCPQIRAIADTRCPVHGGPREGVGVRCASFPCTFRGVGRDRRWSGVDGFGLFFCLGGFGGEEGGELCLLSCLSSSLPLVGANPACALVAGDSDGFFEPSSKKIIRFFGSHGALLTVGGGGRAAATSARAASSTSSAGTGSVPALPPARRPRASGRAAPRRRSAGARRATMRIGARRGRVTRAERMLEKPSRLLAPS